MDPDLGSAFTRLVSDTRAAEAARQRVRERHLRDAASADATLLGIIVDLAEERAQVTVTADIGRSVTGRITVVTLDAVGVGPSLIPLRAVATIRRPPGHWSGGAASGDRLPTRQTSFAVLLGELALDRPHVAIGLAGEPALVTGELRGAGADVLTVRVEGDTATTIYVSVATVSLVTVLASG